MKIDEIELKPCPFCGSTELRIIKALSLSKDLSDFTMIDNYINCLTCGTEGPKKAYVDDVKEAWNERKT